MVVVRISSGLGNQMFQYALYCAFREKGLTVKADINVFSKKNERRYYELEKVFGIKVPLASRAEIAAANIISKISWKLFNKPYKEYPEVFGIWDAGILQKKAGYINGYWQSEKYFKHIAETIRNEFAFIPVQDTPNRHLLHQVRSVNSISIHIRRTDYVSGFNWGINPSYYHTAIALMKSKVADPHFYFFSDDMIWVKQHFTGDNFYYVDLNEGENSFRDMQLMSNCKHHIIANSTFSWWGAWLNPFADKIVIAPDKWLPHVEGLRDIIPDEWIKLPVELGNS